MSIKEISFSLGIEDQYYFSRMFAKLMNASPKEYRNRNKSS
jgi:AraC family transcriptional regulator, arabinose operon regulatory protein